MTHYELRGFKQYKPPFLVHHEGLRHCCQPCGGLLTVTDRHNLCIVVPCEFLPFPTINVSLKIIQFELLAKRSEQFNDIT
jgi:hypothetical protein